MLIIGLGVKFHVSCLSDYFLVCSRGLYSDVAMRNPHFAASCVFVVKRETLIFNEAPVTSSDDIGRVLSV